MTKHSRETCSLSGMTPTPHTQALASANLPINAASRRPVIVAMVTMWMVEVTFHQVVCMIAVRNRFVSTTGSMFVALLVRFAIVVRGTQCLIFPAHADLVLVNMATVLVVEVSVMNIILMAIVLHGRMSAVRTMYMRVRFVNRMIGFHLISPYP